MVAARRSCPLAPLLASLAVAAVLAAGARSATVTISNTEPRRDVDGNLMDAHDGNVVQWETGGHYYWYGMGYGDYPEGKSGCSNQGPNDAGFRNDHNVSVWSSPDLVKWTLVTKEALSISDRPVGIYFRPKVVQHPTTKKFVLWVNYMQWPCPYKQGFYLTATSDRPEGPFVIQNRNVSMTQRPGILCDFDLLVDDDGAAYMIYTVWKPVGPPPTSTHMSIEKLSSDYLSSSLVASPVFTGPDYSADEGPVLVQRKGVYYVMFGHGCCFCQGGSGVNVFTSSHPLGPYQGSGSPAPYDIACAGGASADPRWCPSVVHAQQNCVFSVGTTSGPVLVWTGDRWQSAPDGLKSHDFQYWTPLEWDDSVTPPRLRRFQWRDNFTLDLS